MERERDINFEVINKEKEAPVWLKKVRAYYAGETHAHSKWSDRRHIEGGGIEKNVHNEERVLEYAEKLGLAFVFFSEHASNPGQPRRLSEQHPICQSLLEEKQRIDEINLSGKYKPRAFLAVEASIFFDENNKPAIDVPTDILAKVDLVIASRHAIAEQREPAKIKESLSAAIDNPEVDIIAPLSAY